AQGHVRFDRRRQLRRTAAERPPRAVGALLRADPQRRVLGLVGRADAEELAEQEVLRVHRDVGLELPLPEAARVLRREQALAGALHGGARLGEGVVIGWWR